MASKYKQFFHGKGIPKNNTSSKPLKGVPNTNLDTYNSTTGAFRSRRKFGVTGFAVKDMDVSDEKHPIDHVHDFKNGKRIKIPRKPTKKERKEFRKAKRKRRIL